MKSRTSADIFRTIMDNGPMTLYSAAGKTRISIGTLHRHLKYLNNSGKIRIYEFKNKGRRRIEYGPTLHGMIDFYRHDKEFARKIENYFLLWIDNKQFQHELEMEGFDTSFETLKISKHLFRKYMDYFSAVEQQIEKIQNNRDLISRDLLVILSSEMLSSDPRYYQMWMELYAKLPGMQKSLDDYMENTIRSYKEFKRNFKKKFHPKAKK